MLIYSQAKNSDIEFLSFVLPIESKSFSLTNKVYSFVSRLVSFVLYYLAKSVSKYK